MITLTELIGLLLFGIVLAALTPPLGRFMAGVLEGGGTFLSPVLGNMETALYSRSGIDPSKEMDWKEYTLSVVIFNAAGFLVLFLLLVFQSYIPLNWERMPGLSWHLAFNTAVSFMTNTNWQSYGGESTLSNIVQMLGMTVQNFLSAATGIAVLAALGRGIARKTAGTIGNFWTDLVRSTLYILLPLSIILAGILISEGSVQTLTVRQSVTTLDGATQTIPLGTVASQIAIKQLGTNGGGYYNANSAHPFENPTPLTNFLSSLAILLIASALVYTYGIMVNAKRHAWVVWAVMMFLFTAGLGLSLWSEYSANPVTQIAGSMEGKETRIGVANTVLWSVATTDASNGSINGAHDSLSPLTGMVAMLNMQLGEIIFGGAGSGLYGMIAFIILTVFIAGLMVGRTPEYLGKKIEAFEVKMAILAMILVNGAVLTMTAAASVLDAGLSSLANAGPHGFSEILYAFTSASNNNGSALAGLNANTPFYNVTLGICMLIGRFGFLVPMLAVAGSLSKKKITPASSGTFPTDTALFAVLLLGTIIIIGALTFFPAQVFGPIIEHLLMLKGQIFS
ncbi:MAG: potassium-transporting ATPase subunit KdpA [Acidobacteriota bacterium]